MKKLIVLFLLISISCQKELNFTRQNSDSDKRDAEKVTGAFFDNLLLNRTEQNTKLFSENFFKEIPKEELVDFLQNIEGSLGKVNGKELDSWQTNVVSGTSPISEYLLVYKVEREKYPSIESFYLVKDVNDSIKILNYNINSKGLLPPKTTENTEKKDSLNL